VTHRPTRAAPRVGRSSGSRPWSQAAVWALLLWGPTGCGDAGGATAFLSIGTGGTGGVYYPLGGAIANRMSQRDPERRYTAEVTGGSVENVNRLREGQIDLGFALGVTTWEAYHGGQDYDRPVDGLRVVAPLYPNVTHLLVARGVEAASVEDLRGMRVSVGSAGSGTEQMSRQLLEAVGLTYDDVDERYISFTESANALRDGAIDAALLSVGYPAAAVLEATTNGGARLLPVEGEAVRVLLERYPYYAVGGIPAGVYPGATLPVPTVSMMNWVVGLDSLDGDVVRLLLDVLVDGRAPLSQVHGMAERIEMERLDDSPIPLHPATERWWNEVRERAESNEPDGR